MRIAFIGFVSFPVDWLVLDEACGILLGFIVAVLVCMRVCAMWDSVGIIRLRTGLDSAGAVILETRIESSKKLNMNFDLLRGID